VAVVEVLEEPPRRFVPEPPWQPPPLPPLEEAQLVRKTAKRVTPVRDVDLDKATFYSSTNTSRHHWFENGKEVPFLERNGMLLLATSDPYEIHFMGRYSGTKTEIREITPREYEKLLAQEEVPPPPNPKRIGWRIFWSTNATRPLLLWSRVIKFALHENESGGIFSGYFLTKDANLAAELEMVALFDRTITVIDVDEFERRSGMEFAR